VTRLHTLFPLLLKDWLPPLIPFCVQYRPGNYRLRGFRVTHSNEAASASILCFVCWLRVVFFVWRGAQNVCDGACEEKLGCRDAETNRQTAQELSWMQGVQVPFSHMWMMLRRRNARKKCSEAKPECAFCVRNGLKCEVLSLFPGPQWEPADCSMISILYCDSRRSWMGNNHDGGQQIVSSLSDYG
jgi:hypothetical protein